MTTIIVGEARRYADVKPGDTWRSGYKFSNFFHENSHKVLESGVVGMGATRISEGGICVALMHKQLNIVADPIQFYPFLRFENSCCLIHLHSDQKGHVFSIHRLLGELQGYLIYTDI